MSEEYSKLVRQTAHGSLALLVGQVLSAVILAVGTIIVAGIIGPIHYGEYSKVFVPISMALLLQDPGMNAALTRYVSMYHSQGNLVKQSNTIITGLITSLSTAVVLSTVLYLLATPIAAAFLQQGDLDQLLKIASFAVIGQALINATNSVFIGYMRVNLQNLTQILYSILKGVSSSALVVLGYGLGGAVVGQVASYLIASVVALIVALVYLKRGPGITRPSWKMLRELLSFGVPVYMSSLVSGSTTQLFNSLMVLYVVNEEIGNYGAALNFTVLLSFLTVPIQTTIYPLFSKLEKGSEYLKNAYQNAVKYSALVAIPGALALIGLANPVISTVYGVKYPTAPLYFTLFLITYMPIGLGSTCQSMLLNSQGMTRATMWKNLFILLIGGPMALILVPRYGIVGLLACLIVSPYPPLLYIHYFIKRNLGITFDITSSNRIYLSSIVSLAATLALLMVINLAPTMQLFAGAVAYLVTYLLMLKATRTLNDDDYRMFNSMLGTTGPLSKPLLKLLRIYEDL
jgi:stage V sporulation protein B